MFNFDPSKMDPKTLQEASELLRQLPPDQISKLQTLMHNTMGGFDVTQQMKDFEAGLPPGFREKLARLMYLQSGALSTENETPLELSNETAPGDTENLDIHSARLTILDGVAQGRITPAQALGLLFPV